MLGIKGWVGHTAFDGHLYPLVFIRTCPNSLGGSVSPSNPYRANPLQALISSSIGLGERPALNGLIYNK